MCGRLQNESKEPDMHKLANIAATIGFCAVLASVPAHSANFISAGDLGDGRIQVFAIQSNGQIQSRWKTSTDPNSGWTAWSTFQTPAGGVTTISVGYLSDKRMQLFATQPNGNTVSCWKQSTDPNAGWTPWSPF
jgi:hypothetical protein